MKTIYSFCFKVSAQNMGNEYCIIIAEAGSHTRKENTRNIPRFLSMLPVGRLQFRGSGRISAASSEKTSARLKRVRSTRKRL